jgi:hypothetical protein
MQWHSIHTRDGLSDKVSEFSDSFGDILISNMFFYNFKQL